MLKTTLHTRLRTIIGRACLIWNVNDDRRVMSEFQENTHNAGNVKTQHQFCGLIDTEGIPDRRGIEEHKETQNITIKACAWS